MSNGMHFTSLIHSFTALKCHQTFCVIMVYSMTEHSVSILDSQQSHGVGQTSTSNRYTLQSVSITVTSNTVNTSFTTLPHDASGARRNILGQPFLHTALTCCIDVRLTSAGTRNTFPLT